MTGKRRGRIAGLWLFILLMAVCPVRVLAAKHTSQWVRTKGRIYYYGEESKKLKGWQEIGGKTYWFDKKGIQRTGWRKIDGDYYFFRISDGSKGYLMKDTQVNGVKLQEDGKAKLTSRSKRRLKIMTKCQSIADKQTNASMKKAEKLKTMFEYAKTHYRAKNIGGFKSSGDWDMYYAEYMLNHDAGDCYCYGAIFGYLANAVGATKVKIVSSGGHGWTEIGSKYYDANWAKVIGTKKCYGATKSQSGRSGRPNWAKYGKFKKDLSK